MSSLRRSRGKAKGFRTADHWPSTVDIDGFVWNLAEPTGPTLEDTEAASRLFNEGSEGHRGEQPPDEYYDALAAESEALDRLERGLM